MLIALGCLAIWLLPEDVQQLLVYNRSELVAGEWWRLWSAHLTHYNASQLMADSGLVALLGVVASRYGSAWRLCIALIVAMPLMSLLLFWLVPDMMLYRGASGLAALLWLLVGLQLISKAASGSRQFWIGVLFLLFLVVKVTGEAFALFPAFSDLPAGVVVAWQMHLFGMMMGVLIFLGCLRFEEQ